MEFYVLGEAIAPRPLTHPALIGGVTSSAAPIPPGLSLFLLQNFKFSLKPKNKSFMSGTIKPDIQFSPNVHYYMH